MFHTYVLAWHGKVVDIGRAQFLMDKELAKQAAEWVDANIEFLKSCLPPEGSVLRTSAEPTEHHKAQAFWDYYCERHREKYGAPFTPNVDPAWD